MTARPQISVFKAAAIYMGSVMGAGFASGQEIMQFFFVHGQDAHKAVILATLLFAYLGAVTLFAAHKLLTNHYVDLVRYLFGAKSVPFFDVLVMALLLGSVSVMFSGSGAVIAEHLHWPRWLGPALAAIMCCIILWPGLTGILWLNVIIAPTKIMAITLLCLLIIHLQSVGWLNSTPGGNAAPPAASRSWLLSAVLYVSYNLILVQAVLATLGAGLSPKRAIMGGLLGGVGLGVGAGLLCWAGLALSPEIFNYQVPTIYMASLIFGPLTYPMAFLIWLAILTTALANTHGLAARLGTPGSARYRCAVLGIVGVALPLAAVDFHRLVGLLYPVFGYAGLALLLALLLAPLKMLRSGRKRIR